MNEQKTMSDEIKQAAIKTCPVCSGELNQKHKHNCHNLNRSLDTILFGYCSRCGFDLQLV